MTVRKLAPPAVRAQLIARLGEPRTAHVATPGPRVEVLGFRTDRYDVWSTCGLSAVLMPQAQRLELVVQLRKGTAVGPAIVELLSGTAQRCVGPVGETLAFGDLIDRVPLSLRALGLTAMTIAPALIFDEPARTLDRYAGRGIDLAWLVPLHANEADLVRRYGTDSFMTRASLARLSLFEPHRDPLPTLVDPATCPTTPARLVSRPRANSPVRVYHVGSYHAR